MMVDRNLVITYVNQSTINLFREHEATFKEHYPGFSADELVGSSIDQFHQNPEHQRRVLSDPRNLPYRAEMSVGKLRFAINVVALLDSRKQHVGCALEWQDVTGHREREAEIERLTQAIEQASTALMMVDESLTITYVNESTRRLLRNREAEIRKHFPDFSVDKLIGTNIDVFHATPQKQHALLQDTSSMPRQSMIRLGPLSFRTNLSATFDREGRRIGSTMEWNDVSEQVQAEHQIERLIEGAASGRLEERIDTSDWQGFVQKVGDGVNELLDAVETPIRSTTKVAASLARNDLTKRVEETFQGEFASLGTSINSSIENLRTMVEQIQDASIKIAQGANELNEGNTNLSARTEEQAAALEETASTVEELTSTVKQNAASAGQANQLTTEARDKAERGGDVVSQAVSAMSQINESSRRISDIISVIDEIAFQTNLLALNAAVEAARAGEQGRGFAVVASEVRNLAQRSASAAKEIKTLIRDSVSKVEDGSRLVDQSGSTLRDIILHVKKVSDIIAEIAAASDEQANGIEQVNQAVSQMDQMTQQNAALVEQAAAASASVDEQAQSMERLVRNFEVGAARDLSNEVWSSAPAKPAKPMPTDAPEAEAGFVAPKAPVDDQEWQEF